MSAALEPRTENSPRVARAIQVAKMTMYFVLVLAGARILQEILVEVSTTDYVTELSRVSGLVAQVLDVNKSVDDLIITFFALSCCFLLILPVAWVHTLTRVADPDPSLTQTLIMVSIIVTGVMILLEDNLARSFSLVGVVAAVRYRNTLKDPKDAVYVFLSLGIGMACGLQIYHVALLLSIFECAILLVLWVFHAGAPAVDEAGVLAQLKEKEKKGDRSPVEALQWLSADARERLEADLEQQSRYITMAALYADKKGRRPNCVISVVTDGSEKARDAVNVEMDDHRGKWRLLETRNIEGAQTLEYLGRLSRRRSPPSSFLERLREADVGVKTVSYRSLRKMVPEHAEAGEPDPADEDDEASFFDADDTRAPRTPPAPPSTERKPH